MSIPYMPLYVADYEADTAHLSMEEDGIYTRLLRLCWRTPGCSVPDDPAWLARQLRVTPEYFAERVEPIIAEFFKRQKARLFSSRQREIFARVTETAKKRSNAGRKGGRPAKGAENNENGESRAEANGKPGFINGKAGPKHLKPKPNYKKDARERARFSNSQGGPAPALHPAYKRGLSFGELATRQRTFDWAKTGERPAGLRSELAAYAAAELIADGLITEDEWNRCREEAA